MSKIAELIEESGAIKYGTFELSNGSIADYYVDKYVFETQPDVLEPIVAEIAARLDDETIDLIVGPALGAVPLVTGVSLHSGIDAAFIRQGTKEYGTKARVEGTIEAGDRVVIVEDVTTTGGTVVETADLVSELGAVVERLIVVVDRNEGADENVAAAGYDLESLVRVGDELVVDSA